VAQRPLWFVSRQAISHLIFFSAALLPYNPFITMSAATKFGLLAVMMFGGALLGGWGDILRQRRPRPEIVIFVLLYGIALVRIHYISPSSFEESFTSFVIMGALSMLCFLASCIRVINFDPRLMRWSLLATTMAYTFWIIRNFEDLSDNLQRETYLLGNLKYDSYQTTATILGLCALSALGTINIKKPVYWANLPAAAVYLTCGYFIFQGLGRGEAVAFIVATTLYLAPRIALVVAPFSYVLLNALAFGVDTPLTERLRIMYEGDLGARDVLYGMSLTQLGQEPSLLIGGGGLNAFQDYWGLSTGEYPHNILLDALISGGLPLALVMILIYIAPPIRATFVGVRRRLSADERFSIAIMAFLVLIQLKSGSMLAAWDLFGFTCLFLAARSITVSKTSQSRALVPVRGTATLASVLRHRPSR